MTQILRAFATIFVAAHLLMVVVVAQDTAVKPLKPDPDDGAVTFREGIQPLLQKYCLRCHNVDNMKSGVRVDGLNGALEDRQLFLWKAIQKQIDEGAMPPVDEPQFTEAERIRIDDWVRKLLTVARSRPAPKNGAVRRLTVSQYRNTLRSLLDLNEDLAKVLPPDGISKDGFSNNSQGMTLSPLQIESYFDIAAQALDLCVVDESRKPTIQSFRVEIGKSKNANPCPDKLVLGANSFLLDNADVLVTELRPEKPFEYRPFRMRTAYDFIEGYVGNDTIREWRHFDSIYHSVFACMRGTPGYPKGEAHQVASEGLLLRPAIPSPEIFGQSNTYGPMANFKISLRELPHHGNFRVTVKAARFSDGLLLNSGAATRSSADSIYAAAEWAQSSVATVNIPSEGIYQVDVLCSAGKPQGVLSLTLGERQFAGRLEEAMPAVSAATAESPDQPTAFLLVRLPAGELKVTAKYGDNSRLRRIGFSRLADDSDPAKQFQIFEQRSPSLGVYLGLRRDCGSTLTQVGARQRVSDTKLQSFVFEGAIRDFPNPDVEEDNVNYLAGIREIGVRSEYTDGRDLPRLLVHSVEFEGPFYSEWPPASHRKIFIESPHQDVPEAYARDIISSFATRAFRRPATTTEIDAFVKVWRTGFAEKGDFRQSIKNALLVVLTSPQFLFLIENSAGPEPEDLDPHELASKLSYFLWNSAPDQRLLDLAAQNTLAQSLDLEVERMILDPRFGLFMKEFAAQWLSLDKFDVVAIDSSRYPKLTRDVKTQLREEPIEYLQHVIRQNLSARLLVRSDFILANEAVASYYNLGNRIESGFQFVPIQHENQNLGGLLTQAGILVGLSDGRESNPIKRGAWLTRKIIAEPPDDPPPNVPQLMEDAGSKLTLRERLERHRNQPGCVKCHSGIDPWGIPFESFDAGGLRKQANIDTRSTLPDGTAVHDLSGLKDYLADERIDQVAFSFMKHLACYATGRSLSYNEIAFLQEQGLQLKADGYRMQDVIRFIIKSDLFLKK